jgi:glycosyltransferase involved in cell wall biosynthesis
MSSSSPLVSVVIACYNHASFLSEAIESALAQTYSPLEIVVVDDGSTDDSAHVAGRYPVQLIQQPNQGLAAAGNAGVRASHGEFVMRLDADDRLRPTYIQEALQPLLDNPDVHFVYTQVEYFGARSGSYPTEEFDPESLAERNYIHASAIMRRASFERVGGYNADMRGLRCEDWDLWLSFVDHGFAGKLIRKPLLEYRQHASGSMVTIDIASVAGLRRELAIVARLHDHHPIALAPAVLAGRLRLLAPRLRTREVTPRYAGLLIGFYVVLMLRHMYCRLSRHAAVPSALRQQTR